MLPSTTPTPQQVDEQAEAAVAGVRGVAFAKATSIGAAGLEEDERERLRPSAGRAARAPR